MGKRVIGNTKALILGAALLPVAILACVVLIQGGTLSPPDTQAIVATRPPPGVPPRPWGTELKRVADGLADINSTQSDAITYGWVGVIVALAMGGGLAALLWPSPERRTAQPALLVDGGDRSVLIEACIDVSDTVPTATHREELIEALAKVGVQRVDVLPGEPFDAKRHRAVGRVPTTDPRRHDQVAETERVGFVDHGHRLRYPRVLVYDGINSRRRDDS